MTTVVFKVVTKGAENKTEFHSLNSPFTSQSVLVFEGKEAYQEVKDALERLLGELATIKTEGIEVDGVGYFLKLKGGGDMKWINMMLGLATCSHTHCCSYCECAKNELHLKKKFTLRTATTLLEGAHLYHSGVTFPWQCPYCQKCFQTKEEMQNEPAPTSEKKRLEYQLLHKGGVMFHRGPIDVLHFLLREIAHAIEITCRRRCTTQDQVDKLAKYLQEHVKCFIKLRKVKKKTGVTEEKTPNIIGRECALTLQHSEGMVLRHGDLLDFSMQDLEHLHSQRKTHLRHHGNKRKTGNLKSRTAQSLQLEVADRIISKSQKRRDKSRYQNEKIFQLRQLVTTAAPATETETTAE
ncbi:hypothetical protein CYMTET_38593 [Cymbomonas tetramitiformis]|uniref:Uncharacterized protein n=1 Tax=Cymbomonas tetramitiformis TaxID=36881 RepID=A0AAE0F6F4_9CHLO|nr:hypothetical protein CYMTET_38593 [Cymbomonas tetramitiformis]